MRKQAGSPRTPSPAMPVVQINKSKAVPDLLSHAILVMLHIPALTVYPGGKLYLDGVAL